MDADRHASPPHGLAFDATPTPDDIGTRVIELEEQLEALTVETEDAVRRAREAVDRVQRADERVAELERLLVQSRRHRSELEAKDPRRSLFEQQLEAVTFERDQLRDRAVTLGMRLSTAIAASSAVTSERARADRMQAQRDAARAQVDAERLLTMASEKRATRAEARLAVLDSPMLEADRRLAATTVELRAVLGIDGPDGEPVLDLREEAGLDGDQQPLDAGQ